MRRILFLFFVETTLPEGGASRPLDFDATIEFTVNGVTSEVVVEAQGQDVVRMREVILEADTRFTAEKPYQIFDSLVVARGAVLTLEAGTQLCFHDGASLVVRGTLLSEGTVDMPVNLSGDRTGNVVADIFVRHNVASVDRYVLLLRTFAWKRSSSY